VNKKSLYVNSAFVLTAVAASAFSASPLNAQNNDDFHFVPNTLVLMRSVYVGDVSTVIIGETLPPNCVNGNVSVPLIGKGNVSVGVSCGVATADGTFPSVFYNASSDASFGITSPILIDNLNTNGHVLSTLAIPTDQIVTSFSSKSELAVHLSIDGKSLTFVGYRGGPGYLTAPNLLDVSASNTPGVIDPTNPSTGHYYRAVAEVGASGQLTITDGNAYSGDNGRGAIKGGNGFYYMVGNDNSGNLSKAQLSTTQVGVNLVNSTGAEFLIPGQSAPLPPDITMIGKFSVANLGYPKDKPGKDTNYRGVTIFNNTLYISKGSGGNGINTVYQVGTTGTLPTGDAATLLRTPTTILTGFPTVLASGVALDGSAGNPVSFPFGLWFADANTLYVCDEGDGTLVSPPVNGNVATPYSQATGGVQKWSLVDGTWKLDYVLNKGLNIGMPYGVPNYPAALNPATGGCRHITGQTNGDGTVTLYATTSTISPSGDQGADPNELVRVTDMLSSTTLPLPGRSRDGAKLGEFTILRSAGSGEVFRGLDWAPTKSGE
jgi:hypothetical protein